MHVHANEVVRCIYGVSGGGEFIKGDSCRIPSNCKSSWGPGCIHCNGVGVFPDMRKQGTDSFVGSFCYLNHEDCGFFLVEFPSMHSLFAEIIYAPNVPRYDFHWKPWVLEENNSVCWAYFPDSINLEAKEAMCWRSVFHRAFLRSLTTIFQIIWWVVLDS